MANSDQSRGSDAAFLRESMHRLEERVARLELGLAQVARQSPPTSGAIESHSAVHEPSPASPASPASPLSPPPPPPPPFVSASLPLRGRGDAAAVESLAETASNLRGSSERTSLEFTVGGRVAAWVGSLVVVVAMAFFIKYAYDRNWLGNLAPGVRCAIAAVVGLALIATGEFVRRRIGRGASVGISAAGLGVVYLAAWATHGYFHLISPDVAFLLLIAVVLIGVAVSWRAQSAVIGSLTLIAGYAAPLIAQRSIPILTVVEGHLLAILLVAVVLSALARRPFRILRVVGMALHGAIGAGLVFIVLADWMSQSTQDWLALLTFLTLSWALVWGESFLASLRGETGTLNAITAFLASIWLALLSTVVLHRLQGDDLTLAAGLLLVLAATIVALVETLGDGVDALRRRPTTPEAEFATAAWLSAGVLLLACSAMFFDRGGWTIAWLGIAVAAVELGRRTTLTALSRYGLATCALALVKLFTLDALDSGLRPTVLVWESGPLVGLKVSFTLWSVMAIVAAVAVALVGMRRHVEPGRQRSVTRLASFLLACAILIVVGMVVAPDDQPIVSLFWAVVGGGLIAAGFIRHRKALRVAGLAMLGVVVLKFLLVDLHESETIARVVAFGVVGLLLVATSVVYQRLGSALFRRSEGTT